MKDRLITVARLLLGRGEPLPVDLHARLMAEGVDVAALERRYGI